MDSRPCRLERLLYFAESVFRVGQLPTVGQRRGLKPQGNKQPLTIADRAKKIYRSSERGAVLRMIFGCCQAGPLSK